MGEEASLMYFIKSGVFGYELAKGGFLDAPLEAKAWVSESVLWTLWRHRGCLWADDPSEVVTVTPQGFAEIMKIHPRTWDLARNYASDYIDMLNRIPPRHLSDVVNDDMKEFYTRSLPSPRGKA